MNTVWRVTTLSAVLVLFVVVIPVAATASGTPCVTRGEYSQVHIGMGKHRVSEIFDTSGTVVHDGPYREERAYKGCRSFGVVFVTYRNEDNTVIHKEWARRE
jgi:hypothetical protein